MRRVQVSDHADRNAIPSCRDGRPANLLKRPCEPKPQHVTPSTQFSPFLIRFYFFFYFARALIVHQIYGHFSLIPVRIWD